MSSEMKKKSGKGFKVFIVLLLVTLVGGVMVGFISRQNTLKRIEEMESVVNKDTIYNNIFINGIHIGGLSKKDAIKEVYDKLNNDINGKKIALNGGKDNYEIELSKFDIRYPIAESVIDAFSYAREGELKERYEKVSFLDKNPHEIEIVHSFNEELIDKYLDKIAEENYVAPKNATMKRENGEFITTKGSDGSELDYEATGKQMKELLVNLNEGTTDIAMKIVEHEFNENDLKEGQQLIGSGKTFYSGRGSGRVTNMDTAAEKINNYIVYPGEIFSTNDAFGAMTYENGYRDAPVIQSGELVEGMGGGICQNSSTLYSALLYSELEIVERRNHSLKVGYMDWAFDATLAGNYIDLKFKNDTEYPVFIESYLSSNEVVVNIYGKEIHSPSRTLEFKNALVSTNSPKGENVTYSSSLPAGSRHVKTSALTGYVYDLFKYVYEDGALVEKVQVNRSTYKPRQAQVVVGTGSSAPESSSGISNTEEVPSAQNTEVPENAEENQPIIDQPVEE